METRRNWPDLQFTALWTNQGDKYADTVAYFKLYRIEGWEPDEKGAYTVPLYEQIDASSSMDMVTDLSEAQVFLEVSIKWDGCSHWNPASYWHLCGQEDLENLCMALVRVWKWAKELGMDR